MLTGLSHAHDDAQGRRERPAQRFGSPRTIGQCRPRGRDNGTVTVQRGATGGGLIRAICA